MAFTGQLAAVDRSFSTTPTGRRCELCGVSRNIVTFREALPSRANNDQSAIDYYAAPARGATSRLWRWIWLRPPDDRCYEPDRAKMTSIGWSESAHLGWRTHSSLSASRATGGRAGEDAWRLRDGRSVAAAPGAARRWPVQNRLVEPLSALPADIVATCRASHGRHEEDHEQRPTGPAGVRMSKTKPACSSSSIAAAPGFGPMEVEGTMISTAATDGSRLRLTAQDPDRPARRRPRSCASRRLSVKVERPDWRQGHYRAAPLASQAEAGNVRILVTGDPGARRLGAAVH